MLRLTRCATVNADFCRLQSDCFLTTARQKRSHASVSSPVNPCVAGAVLFQNVWVELFGLGGVIGSHSRLKICRRKSYRFDSGPSHQSVIGYKFIYIQNPLLLRAGFFVPGQCRQRCASQRMCMYLQHAVYASVLRYCVRIDAEAISRPVSRCMFHERLGRQRLGGRTARKKYRNGRLHRPALAQACVVPSFVTAGAVHVKSLRFISTTDKGAFLFAACNGFCASGPSAGFQPSQKRLISQYAPLQRPF